MCVSVYVNQLSSRIIAACVFLIDSTWIQIGIWVFGDGFCCFRMWIPVPISQQLAAGAIQVAIPICIDHREDRHISLQAREPVGPTEVLPEAIEVCILSGGKSSGLSVQHL